MQLIGLAGPLKSGKDTIADYLVAAHGYMKVGFADKIREELSAAFPDHDHDFENQDMKDEPSFHLALFLCCDAGFLHWLKWRDIGTESGDCSVPHSPRWLQQQWGDYRRATAGWDYFICAVREQIEAAAGPVVVSGLRYAATAPIPTAEADLIRQLGGWVWHIDRPGYESSAEHTTEISLPRIERDFTIKNDSGVEVLYDQINTILAKLVENHKPSNRVNEF